MQHPTPWQNRWRRTETWLAARGDLFWLMALAGLGALIYLPYLGAYPLWDPWEPHYTQVAWEMQQRDSWNNPWYRGMDNWWSKPIATLWMLRASLALFWDSAANFADNEWAARLPFALAAIAGCLLQYDWVRRLFGRGVGLLAAIILMTAPQYLLIGRQVMVDLPFAVAHAASIGYLAVGLFALPPTDRDSSSSRERALWARAAAWLRQQWPFIAFWGLQAFAVLFKGLVAPALSVLGLAAYGAATFRWRDYSVLTAGRRWGLYILVRGVFSVGVAGAAVAGVLFLPAEPENKRVLLQGLILAAAGVSIFLGVWHDLPPARHALRLLARMRAAWGLALFLVIAAPWYVSMSLRHGWPFWNEFIFYHHLGRAAGTIDKPSAPFDYYVRQMGFALFPWSGLFPAVLWRFLGRASPLRSIAERRNCYLLFAALMPFLFFTLSGTKFAHYVFPIVPIVAAMIAAALLWLGQSPPEEPPLQELGTPLGPAVPPQATHDEQPWWKATGAKGDLVVFTALTLVTFGLLSHDLVLDFRHFLRLFIYYYNRGTPLDYRPFIELQIIFFPIGVVLGLLLLTRWITRWQLVGICAGAVALACYLGWVTMPAMQNTYSFKPFLGAYQSVAKPGEPIGQYVDWQQPVRSVIFLFQNRTTHLKTDKQATHFLKRPGRKFILVDRNRLAALRKLAKETEQSLHVVFDGHPYGRLVSNEPNPEDVRKVAEHIVEALPNDARPIDARYGDFIQLLGWKVDSDAVRSGDSIQVSLYFKALALMDRDWQIFVHGDGSRAGSHRIHRDHYPIEGLYPTTEWQEGEIVEDTFSLRVPKRYPYDYFQLWFGWYIGAERLKLSNNPPSDGQNRVRGPRITVVRD